LVPAYPYLFFFTFQYFKISVTKVEVFFFPAFLTETNENGDASFAKLNFSPNRKAHAQKDELPVLMETKVLA